MIYEGADLDIDQKLERMGSLTDAHTAPSLPALRLSSGSALPLSDGGKRPRSRLTSCSWLEPQPEPRAARRLVIGSFAGA